MQLDGEEVDGEEVGAVDGEEVGADGEDVIGNSLIIRLFARSSFDSISTSMVLMRFEQFLLHSLRCSKAAPCPLSLSPVL